MWSFVRRYRCTKHIDSPLSLHRLNMQLHSRIMYIGQWLYYHSLYLLSLWHVTPLSIISTIYLEYTHSVDQFCSHYSYLAPSCVKTFHGLFYGGFLRLAKSCDVHTPWDSPWVQVRSLCSYNKLPPSINRFIWYRTICVLQIYCFISYLKTLEVHKTFAKSVSLVD